MEKQLRRYILPNILAMLGTSCYLLADTFFISLSAGANGMTALNLVLPVYGLMFAIGAMIGVGSATRYSLEKAAGREDARHYFSNACWFSPCWEAWCFSFAECAARIRCWLCWGQTGKFKRWESRICGRYCFLRPFLC